MESTIIAHFSYNKNVKLGGPNGELAASLRYLSQRFSMPTKETKAILNDIGTEEWVPICYHLYFIITINQCNVYFFRLTIIIFI